MKIKSLLVNDQTQALGIDSVRPVFHVLWEEMKENDPACPDQGPSQDILPSFHITVTDSLGVCVWDASGLPADSPYIYYEGEPLRPKNGYKVDITLENGKGVPAGEMVSASFETGFMGMPWQARWVEPEQEDAIEEKELSFFEMVTYVDDGSGPSRLRPCQEVLKRFWCNENIRSARVYASAHGVYDLYINGQRVSKRRLAPECSSYEENLYYQTYDIGEYLVPGENTVSAILADGWWIGRLGMAGDSCNYGRRLGFLMQMELREQDGSVTMVLSDENMVSRPSYIRYSDLFIGEKWDMTFDPGQQWTPCTVADIPMNNLCGQPLPPVQVMDTFSDPRIFYTPSGDLVMDFGQVIAGVVRLTLTARAGDTVILEHSEILDEHGNFKCNILGRNKDQKDIYICRDGEQVFEPRFTYHGFRHVRVSGIDQSQILKAEALVIGTPLRSIGEFSCSDKRLDQLQHNIRWSQISNMCSIPTDCPQREKLGWTGDINVFAPTGCFNYDLKNFLESWLKNMRIAQEDNGEIPVTVPNFVHQDRTQRIMSGSNSSSVWGDACVMVPWYLYMAYGDRHVLEENFPMMEKWMDYIQAACAILPENYDSLSPEEKARNPYLWNKTYHFGDWLIPSLRARLDGVALGTQLTAGVVGSAYYAFVIRHFIRICHILGAEEKATAYETLLPKVCDAVAKTYVDEDGTVNHCSLQGLYVMILACGIVEGDLKQKVADKLVSLIRENDYCLDTGFSSVSYLLDVLYENGYKDVAYKVLFQTKGPSWLYMVENKATTMWENWMAVTPEGIPTDSSYNHYAFGCVGDFIYRRIGGISMAEPGYRKILFAPDLDCGLDNARCSLETPHGLAQCSWEKKAAEESSWQIRIRVPKGTRGIFRCFGEEKILESGTYHFQASRSKTRESWHRLKEKFMGTGQGSGVTVMGQSTLTSG